MYFGLCHNVVCFGVVVVVADLAQHSTAKSSFHSLLLSIQFAVVSGMEKYTQRQTGAGPDSFSRCMALKHCMCLCIDKHFRIYRKSVVCIERCLQLTVCVRVLYLYLYGILVGKKQQRQQQIEFETTSRLGEAPCVKRFFFLDRLLVGFCFNAFDLKLNGFACVYRKRFTIPLLHLNTSITLSLPRECVRVCVFGCDFDSNHRLNTGENTVDAYQVP